MPDLSYWLWLSCLQGIKPETALKYVRRFGSAKSLYYSGEKELKLIEGITEREVRALNDKDTKKASNIYKRCGELGIHILCVEDGAYPERLRNIYNPPLVIYIKGTLPDIDGNVCIGVVGTRRASGYGLQTAERIGRELAEGGSVVITGIAEGIDTAAAKGALKARGSVVAVLGTGVDIVYPAWNSRLQNLIARTGALVSEYPPGTRGSKASFPQRNRIISGLSAGVAIVQAPEKSGALITAARAQEQGRDIFVVPGNVDDNSFTGSNALIRDGACLIRSGQDIIDEYRWRIPRKNGNSTPPDMYNETEPAKLVIDNNKGISYIDLMEQLGQLSEEEITLVGTLSGGELYSDELIARSALRPEAALSALTLLELKGYIKAQPDGRFKLIVINKG